MRRRRHRENPPNDIRYLLVAPPIVSPSVRRHVRAGIASGRYKVIFKTGDGALLRVSRPSDR